MSAAIYEENEAGFVRVRDICMSFEGVERVEEWGHPTFRFDGRIFAAYRGDLDFPYSFAFKPGDDEVARLVSSPLVFASRQFGPGAWLGFDLGEDQHDWHDVELLLRGAYERVKAP